jgi:hypothetical protein
MLLSKEAPSQRLSSTVYLHLPSFRASGYPQQPQFYDVAADELGARVSIVTAQRYTPWPVAITSSTGHVPDILSFYLVIRQSGWDRNVGDAASISKIGRHTQQTFIDYAQRGER